jgi:hypothetical protein
MKERIKALAQKLSAVGIILTAFLFCLTVQCVDIISSSGWGPDYTETNPFCRHADGSFWLAHAIGIKAIFLAEYTCAALIIYFVFRRLGKIYAAAVATIPLLYFALLSLDAAIHNFILHTGWYVGE